MGLAAWIVTEADSALDAGIDTTNVIKIPAMSETVMDWASDFISEFVLQMNTTVPQEPGDTLGNPDSPVCTSLKHYFWNLTLMMS